MNQEERGVVARSFGVAPEQVERDHLISHLLAVVAGVDTDRLVFIGGTALARTHLPDGRLSEDVDLVALDRRDHLAAELDAILPRAVARTHGRLEWMPALADIRDTEPAMLQSTSGLTVKIQLLSSRARTVWPSEVRDIVQRYADAPPARLRVPTLAAFAASKTATWHDRRAARDLWDLWALAGIGAIGEPAGEIYRRYGPTNRYPDRLLFDSWPSEAEWQAQLAAQTRLTVSAAQAAETVRRAWMKAAGAAGQ